jgi:hypothetical protein
MGRKRELGPRGVGAMWGLWAGVAKGDNANHVCEDRNAQRLRRRDLLCPTTLPSMSARTQIMSIFLQQ